MRNLVVFVFLALATAAISGCEKNDYQHPMYRSTR